MPHPLIKAVIWKNALTSACFYPNVQIVLVNLDSVNDVRLESIEDSLSLLVRVDVQVDRLGQVKTEDAHNGLSVNDVTSGNKIEVTVKTSDVIDKVLDFIDGVKRDFNACHD